MRERQLTSYDRRERWIEREQREREISEREHRREKAEIEREMRERNSRVAESDTMVGRDHDGRYSVAVNREKYFHCERENF